MSAQRAQMLAVLAAALGYYVDLYDIVIFGVVRVASLTDLGITGADNTRWGLLLFNLQMVGLLIGGFGWGLVADRYGRRFALIATIAMYSLANLANAFVTTVEQYAVLRLLAGIGLAGELGAGVTLISETLPKHLRGYGATVISFLGLLGAITASFVGGEMHWRVAYGVGGVMGLCVLALRIKVLQESTMFAHGEGEQPLAVLRKLMQGDLLWRFLGVIALGVPVWFVSALFVNFAPEYGKAFGFSEPLKVADVLRWQAIGTAIGSALTGILSERFRSRRVVLMSCIAALALLLLAVSQSGSSAAYCRWMFLVGLAQGYWTVFLILSAEQFGTNLRGTVSSSVPNLVRGTTIPMTLSLQALLPTVGLLMPTFAIGVLVFSIALFACWKLPETYGRDLDYRE